MSDLLSQTPKSNLVGRHLMHHKKSHNQSQPAESHVRPNRKSGALLLVLLVAQLMVILDITAVNIALPSLAQDLELTGSQISWTITSYSLVFGSLLLLGGRAADVLGRRRLFLAGLGVFTVSSLASALAGSASVFFAARRPGAGRRDALARRALDHHRHLPGSRAHQGARRLGRGGRRGRGGRGAARRDAHGVARLASDLLDQPPGWRRRRRRHPARGGARHRSSAVARARPARC